MTTLADMMKSAGITDYDQRSSQDSLNQGAKPEDIVNWWKAKKSGAPMSAPPDDMSLLLQAPITMPDSLGDGSFDQQRYDTMQAQQRLRAKYTDANGVFTPPKSMFGGTEIPKGLAHLNSGRSDIGGQDINDPSKVIHDPVYGDFIDKRYLGQNPGDSTAGFMGQLGKYAPAAISAIMSMGMGAAAGPLIGAVLSGTIGPGGIAPKLAMGDKVDWGKTALNMGLGVAGGALAGGAGGNFIPPEVSSAFSKVSPYLSMGKSIYGAAKNPNAGSIGNAGLTLAQIIAKGL
jgi:hypothetical protein